MKRKTYLVQSAVGQSATRYSFNAANAAALAMVREYARTEGLHGTWTQTEVGKATAPGDSYLTVYGWRVWTHAATGRALRIVCNLQATPGDLPA